MLVEIGTDLARQRSAMELLDALCRGGHDLVMALIAGAALRRPAAGAPTGGSV